jgi:hypothetical protein
LSLISDLAQKERDKRDRENAVPAARLGLLVFNLVGYQRPGGDRKERNSKNSTAERIQPPNRPASA